MTATYKNSQKKNYQHSKTTKENSGPLVVLDSTLGVSKSGSDVTDWEDQTVNGYDCEQTTSSDRPSEVLDATLGVNVISFNGSNEMLNFVKAMPLNKGDFTVLFLHKPNNLDRGVLMGDFGKTNPYNINFELYTIPSGSLRHYFANNPNVVSPTGEFVANQWQIYGAMREGDNFSVFNQSNTLTTVNDPTPANIADNVNQSFGLGRDSRDAQAFDGYMHQVWIFKRALPDVERKDRIIEMIELGKIVPTDYFFAIEPSLPETIIPNGDDVYDGVAISEVNDLSGNDYNIDSQSATVEPTWDEDALNGKGAMLFDGTNDFLERVSSSPSIQGASTFVIVYKSTDVQSGTSGIFSSRRSPINDTFEIGYTSNKLDLKLRSSTGANLIYPIESVASTDTHVVLVTMDGVDNVTIYLDGVFISSNTVATGFNPLYSSFMVGTNRFTTGYFEGYVAPIQIFDRVLNVAEIGALHTTLMNEYNIN